jgi:hypothetical protein
MFESRVLRGIFGPKREEETGGWGKLQTESFLNLLLSGDQVKECDMGGACNKYRNDEKFIQHFNRKARREEITCEI